MDDTNIIIITESENMDTRTILRKVKDGSLSIEEAELAFGRQPYTPNLMKTGKYARDFQRLYIAVTNLMIILYLFIVKCLKKMARCLAQELQYISMK